MITFLRAKIEEGLSRAWQSTLIRARLKEQHPRRESNELKDQFNNAGIFGGRNSLAIISWSVRVSYMMGSVVVKRNRIKTAMLRDKLPSRNNTKVPVKS